MTASAGFHAGPITGKPRDADPAPIRPEAPEVEVTAKLRPILRGSGGNPITRRAVRVLGARGDPGSA
ncbi:hypothetical protein [Methylobacterium sp. WSM2598]|uniref:hypothetical protein n=1 Tax=Methylobacterium sp. WSM2598 TaxID=398261 RepID=UPI0012F6ACA4|nr:hypothetical protein [Methylobacterium sp. WSM2598]